MTFLPEKVVLIADKDKWLPKLLEHFEGKMIERRRTRLSHKNLTLEKMESLKKPLPEGYSLKRIDRQIAESLPKILQVHIPVFFGSVNTFLEKTVGHCRVLCDARR